MNEAKNSKKLQQFLFCTEKRFYLYAEILFLEVWEVTKKFKD